MYNIDPAQMERAITPRTRAVVVVHQIGQPADLDEILGIAASHDLTVIEDAACAIGSEYRGRRVGLPHSSAACFSFHPRKILTTGEGGMITTANGGLAERLRKLRQHAMTISDLVRHTSSQTLAESYDEIGYNYRMTDLQAAIGIVQLQRLPEMLERRRFLAFRYSEKLRCVQWLLLPRESANCRHNYQSYMVALTEDAPLGRDDLMRTLLDQGICTRRGVMAIHRELPYGDDESQHGLPNTEWATDNTIVLPLYHSMTENEQDHVIDCLKNVHAASPIMGYVKHSV